MCSDEMLGKVSFALQCVSTDLDRVQGALSSYEAKAVDSERVSPALREVVTYYRSQAINLRNTMLDLCTVLTGTTPAPVPQAAPAPVVPLPSYEPIQVPVPAAAPVAKKPTKAASVPVFADEDEDVADPFSEVTSKDIK